ncbi:MAG: PIN domain-containing protein [Caldimonas sp.]
MSRATEIRSGQGEHAPTARMAHDRALAKVMQHLLKDDGERVAKVVKAAVIVDTNVVVAGFPTEGNALPVARILRGMQAAAFTFVVSEPLLAEYREVLARPNVCRLHGLAAEAVAMLVDDLARHATVLAPASASAPAAPDPGDQMLWDLLAARADLVLVTGDNRLLRDRGMRGRVISVEAYLAAA